VESLRDHTTKQKSGRSVNWLDFGCGNGAFEGKKSGINILEFENLQEQSFEVITAIEVLEHTHDPRATIQLIYKLLKPGGLFFYTTGNSRPFSNNFLGWRYTSASDVHIGFFEPLTMNKLLEELGFSVQQSENYSGWGNIYKYKVLKNLKIKKRGLGLFVPNFSLIVKALDRKFQLMAMPAGVRPKNK
jgi:SAM-dependent methyltransferase